MRTTGIILTILICTNSYGQLDKLKGTWITPEQDLISINDTSTFGFVNSNKLSNRLLENKYVGLSINAGILNFREKYFNNDSTFADPYDLKISYLDNNTLKVIPISSLSKKFFQNRTIIKFKRQESVVDNSIKFEKLSYHTTPCFGNCPIIDLQIDNKKKIYLKGEFFNETRLFEKDSLRSGQFIGVLTDTLYFELIRLLKTCNLRTLKFNDNLVVDAPEITLIIYFNRLRKYLKSYDPPFIIDDLLIFLNNIDKNSHLTRTVDNLDFE
jgi:hypothetical protein